MPVRIANGYLLTPAPWLRAREPAPSEPIRAQVISAAAAAPRAELVACVLVPAPAAPSPPPPQDVREPLLQLPAGHTTVSSPHAARAAQAYAAASEPLRPWAVGCCLRVQA